MCLKFVNENGRSDWQAGPLARTGELAAYPGLVNWPTSYGELLHTKCFNLEVFFILIWATIALCWMIKVTYGPSEPFLDTLASQTSQGYRNSRHHRGQVRM